MANSEEEKADIKHVPVPDQLLPVKSEPATNIEDPVMDQGTKSETNEPRRIISKFWEEAKNDAVQGNSEDKSIEFTLRMVSPKKIQIEPEDVTENPEKREFKEKFDKQLAEFYDQHQGSQKKPWTKQRIIEVMHHLKSDNSGQLKPYYWLSKYDIMESLHMEYLIYKRKSPDSPIVRIIPICEYFDILYDIHGLYKHGGRDKMLYIIRDKYYIQKKAVEIFVSLCPTCAAKRNLGKKLNTHDFNSGGDLDFIDMRDSPDGVYNWLLLYQNKKTMFFHLRPLKTTQPAEVAFELAKIFLEFGPPHAMHSSNGREFTDEVVKEVKNLWPECKINVRNKGCTDCSKKEISDMLKNWMQENGSNWTLGCYFVQYEKNTALNRVLGKSPYGAVFGAESKVVLKKANISEERT